MNENKFFAQGGGGPAAFPEAASELGHGFPGTEHLPLGLIRRRGRGPPF